jgi:antirestriction protein ArdC
MAGFENPFFLTYNQAKRLGGNVRRGERSTLVVFWKMVNEDNEERDSYPLLRYYKVFNADQCELPEGAVPEWRPAVEAKPEPERIRECERVMHRYLGAPPVRYTTSGRAFYAPFDDAIAIPRPADFDSMEEYYATLFHELIHSTGHAKRLGRKGVAEMTGFGSHRYSFEELIAEMGAAFLCAEAGIDNVTIDNSAAYIDSWRRKLSENTKWIVQAAGQAQKATDYMMRREHAGGEAHAA